MNGKYALALFLALQVTVSLCEIADPDPELVKKFDDMKNTFYSRVMNAYNKAHGIATPYVEQVQAVATPYVEKVQEVATPYVDQVQEAAAPYIAQVDENAQVQAARAFFEELKNREQTQTFVKTVTDLIKDASPMLDKAQHQGLGLYGQYLRPQVGEPLDGAINKIKEYLDLYLPALE